MLREISAGFQVDCPGGNLMYQAIKTCRANPWNNTKKYKKKTLGAGGKAKPLICGEELSYYYSIYGEFGPCEELNDNITRDFYRD